MEFHKTYSFDDVLITPSPTELTSRSEVNLEVSYICKHSKARFAGVPVCVANMDSIATITMAKALYKHKIWVALHKFIKQEELEAFLDKEESKYSFVSMGISEEEMTRINKFRHLKAIAIDAANGYMNSFLDVIKRIRESFPSSIICAGNVCTPEGVENIIKAGADISKVGISNGNFCETKNKTGIGYKQFSVALECGQAANELNALCMSDGGCKSPADICKALGAGSHLVMSGSLFAGYNECDTAEWDNTVSPPKMKMYGMSSKTANDKYFGGLQNYRTSEGREGWVEYKGSVNELAQDIKGSLASCCTYTNTRNLENLYKHCKFTI